MLFDDHWSLMGTRLGEVLTWSFLFYLISHPCSSLEMNSWSRCGFFALVPLDLDQSAFPVD